MLNNVLVNNILVNNILMNNIFVSNILVNKMGHPHINTNVYNLVKYKCNIALHEYNVLLYVIVTIFCIVLYCIV